jgi:hypothetical protein
VAAGVLVVLGLGTAPSGATTLLAPAAAPSTTLAWVGALPSAMGAAGTQAAHEAARTVAAARSLPGLRSWAAEVPVALLAAGVLLLGLAGGRHPSSRPALSVPPVRESRAPPLRG